ncbi:MAG: hydrogenase iron-sulfur subunit [Coriobacteriia bacterium]|nr:hydrogenase iron-sulfur subunit [Coriobacteriia bacterium]
MTLGLYVCRCSGAVDSVVDLEQALSRVRKDAAVVRIVDDLFAPETQSRIESDVGDTGLDAIVLAGPSLGHYTKSLSGQYLKSRLVDAGVNPNRVIVANLLEQVALTHPDDPVGATAKAKALLEVAVMRATMAEAVEGTSIEPLRSVMILGVTAEALVAAQRLLQLGYGVVLADRNDGISRARTAVTMKATASYVLGHQSAEFVDNARMVDGEGWLGDYRITLGIDGDQVDYSVGGLLLARPDSSDWIAELRQHFKVDIDEEGNARSLNPATHPAETVDAGIMVVPIRREGNLERDKVAAADSAALALVLRLSQPRIVHYHDVSAVDETLCGGCASCVRTCAFGACSIGEDGFSHVDVRRCRGCGKCVVSCPVGARDIVNSPHDYLIAAVRALSESDDSGERVLGFLCGGCGYPAADEAAKHVADTGESYPATFVPIRIPCGGRLDTLYVLEAFKVGFDAVVVFRCREGHCHNLIGNLDMDRRINLLRAVLRSRGLDDSRLRIIDISPFEGGRFVEQVNEVYHTISTLTNGKGGPL